MREAGQLAGARLLAGSLLAAGVDERLFEQAERLGRLVQPGEGLLETGATEKGALVAAQPVPGVGGLGQLALAQELLAVGVQPVAQLGPLADERFVGDLYDTRRGRLDRAGGDQAGRIEYFQDSTHGLVVLITTQQLVQRHAAACVRGGAFVVFRLANLSQAEEDGPGDLLLLRREPLVEDRLGGLGDGAAHAAGLVAGRSSSPPPGPRLQQGVGKQRSAGLVLTSSSIVQFRMRQLPRAAG